MDNFSKREGDVVTPSWKIGEDAIRPRNGNDDWHGAVESGDRLEAADRRIVREWLPLAVSGKGEGYKR